MATLQDKIKKGTTSQEPARAPEQEVVSQSEASRYLKELDDISKDPAYSRPGAPSQDALSEAMRQAKDLYQERATRNDWAQVAERVGRAVAQYAGAQAGLASGSKRGQDMSNLDFGAPVDWESRQGRAFQEYQSDVGLAKDEYFRERQASDDLGGQRREDFGRREGYLQTALRDAQARERAERDAEELAIREKGRDARDDAKLRAQNRREDKKLSEAEKSQFDRQASEDRKLELKDLKDQEKMVNDQLVAQQTLFNQLGQEDLKGKSTEDLKKKHGELAGKAGIDLSFLHQRLQAKTKPGILWGTNPDEEAQQVLLTEENEEKKAELKTLREAIKRLSKARGVGTKGEVTSLSQEALPKAGESATVKMRAPDGSIGEIPRENMKAAQDSGLVLVE